MYPPCRALLALTLALPATASADDWLLCPPQPELPSVDVEAPDRPGGTRAAAETAESRGSSTVLRGDAVIRRQSRTVGADTIRFDRQARTAEGTGNVFLREGDFLVEGERGDVDLDSGAFTLDGARYLAIDQHAQGDARRIARDDAGISRFETATYSTCPRGDEDWQLSADSIELNPDTRQGTARNAVLRFQDVPLFYTPWFQFPIGDERMSGLLAPSFGSSSSSGFTFGIPYYWNAAPNFDATIEPRFLARRGFQLRSEWRWLGPAGFWQLNSEFLPDDRQFDDDRTLTRLEHEGHFGDGWRTNIEAEGVSDDEYFDDLSSNLSLSSQTHLRRRADLTWTNAPGGRFRARAETFQTLGERNDPYERVPQLTYEGDRTLAAHGLEAEYETELVQFERDRGDTGTRLNLRPAIARPFETPGWFVTPRIGFDYTVYDLDRQATTGASTPERALPILSVDSGLVFERFGEDFRQTLEPRAFYVYVPEDSQDDLPVFDTGEYNFSFSRLFREHRFSGPDRLADANRLTLALTSRLLDRGRGREVLRASVGVIHFFDDRLVQLPGRPVETEDESDVAAEIEVQPSDAWRTGLDLQWDPQDRELEESSFRARYNGGDNRAFSFGHRFTRDARESVDLSAVWPLSPRWLGVASTRYSLREDRNFESLVGVEYDSCCWKLRTVIRRFASGDGQDNAFLVELVFKGLGGFGDDAGGLLDRAILGYSR